MSYGNPFRHSLTAFFCGKMPAIWGIYIAQGILGGLTFSALPIIFRGEHVSLKKIGLLSFVMMIWAIKFLWAQPVERWRIAANGKRRSRQIILVGEATIIGVLSIIAFLSPHAFDLLFFLLLCAAVAATIVDIACDAFLIEQLPPSYRGQGNMAQIGGAYIGLILGGSLFATLYTHIGWRFDCLLIVAFIFLFTLPMFFKREETIHLPPSDNQLSQPSLLKALKKTEIWRGIMLVIIYEMSGRTIQGLTGPFLIDQGASISMIGIVNGLGGVLSGLCGTLIGGLLMRFIGAKGSMYGIASCQIILLAMLSLTLYSYHHSLYFLISLFIVEAALMAASFVASYSYVMGLVRLINRALILLYFKAPARSQLLFSED